MEPVYFNIISIYFPVLILLFSLGNFMYVTGEFKERFNVIHPVIVRIGIKIFLLLVIELFIIHYVFSFCKFANFQVVAILLSIYMVFELIISNNILFRLNKFIEIKSLSCVNEKFLIKNIRIVLKQYRLMVSFTILIGVSISLILCYNVFFNTSFFITVLFFVFLMVVAINFLLIKTLQIWD